jgi:hypothetical protein
LRLPTGQAVLEGYRSLPEAHFPSVALDFIEEHGIEELVFDGLDFPVSAFWRFCCEV